MSFFPYSDRRHQVRFTLIELLVVVAIIAILASLLLPALSRAKAKAQATACAGNLKQVMLAFQLYADDNGNFTPLAGNWNHAYTDRWYYELPVYMGGLVVPVGTMQGSNEKQPLSAVQSCPTSGYGSSYEQPYMWGYYRLQEPNAVSPQPSGGIHIDRINNPTRVMAFGESRYNTMPAAEFQTTGTRLHYHGNFSRLAGEIASGYGTMEYDRHLTGSNSGFPDGHVEFLSSNFIITEWNLGAWGLNSDESVLFADVEP